MRHTRLSTRLMRWMCLAALLLAACASPASTEPTEVAARPAGLEGATDGEASLQLSLAGDPAGSPEPALPRHFGLTVLGRDHGQLAFEEQPAYPPSETGVPPDNPLVPLPLGLPAGLALDYRSTGPRGHVPVLSPDCPFADTTNAIITAAGTAHTCGLTWVFVEGGPHADEPVAAGEHALLRVVTRVENAGAVRPLGPDTFPAQLARRDGSQAALPGGVSYTPGADPCATGLSQCFNPYHSPTLSFGVVTVDLYRVVSGTTDQLDLDYAVTADATHPEYTTSYEGDCGREGLARAVPGRLLTCTLTHTFTGGGEASGLATSTPIPSPTPLPPTATPIPATPTATATRTPAPVAIRALRLSATSVRSGGTVTVTVELSAPAPKGGAVVALRSSNAVALPVPPSVTVPAGATGTRVSLTAGKVAANTAVTLLGAFNGTKAGAKLTVTP